jgi:hypothetical protein
MNQIVDLAKFFKPWQPAPSATPRQSAEGWVRVFAGSEYVEAAEADAEVEFRKQKLAADWHQPVRSSDFVEGRLISPLLPHWRAGIDYAGKMCLGHAEAAVRQIAKPRKLESFLNESIAIISEKVYREKILRYDDVPGEAEAWAIGQFQEFVRKAVEKDLERLVYAAWQRHKEQQKRPVLGDADANGDGMHTQTETAPPSPAPVPTSVHNDIALDETAVARLAADRDGRLLAFIAEKRIPLTAVDRASGVAKPDRQKWRHGKMPSDSVMAIRIENVLSGKTRLLPEDER